MSSISYYLFKFGLTYYIIYYNKRNNKRLLGIRSILLKQIFDNNYYFEIKSFNSVQGLWGRVPKPQSVSH